MLDFLTLDPEAFGIDVSDSSLKIVKLNKKRANLVLASFGETLIKPGIIKRGKIINEIAFTKSLEKAIKNVKGKKIKTKYAVVSFSEESVFLQVIKIPKMAKEEIESAVRFEAENYIPIPLEKAYLDFQIISSFNDKHNYLEILIAAAPKEIIDSYVSCFEKVGIKLKILEVEPMAIVRALIKKGENLSPILLIDLGADKTSFVIVKNNSIRFSSSIPISTNKFTEAIARALEIETTKAEKLKTKYGLKGPEKIHLEGEKGVEKFKKEIICEEKIFEALIPILTDFVEQTNIYLDYYQFHELPEDISEKGNKLEKIIICGGGANLKGICTFLSLELKILTEPGNPWINISEKIQMPLEDSLRYGTAIGLALRGINKN